jgi:hypothetical protein
MGSLCGWTLLSTRMDSALDEWTLLSTNGRCSRRQEDPGSGFGGHCNSSSLSACAGVFHPPWSQVRLRRRCAGRSAAGRSAAGRSAARQAARCSEAPRQPADRGRFVGRCPRRNTPAADRPDRHLWPRQGGRGHCHAGHRLQRRHRRRIPGRRHRPGHRSRRRCLPWTALPLVAAALAAVTAARRHAFPPRPGRITVCIP